MAEEMTEHKKKRDRSPSYPGIGLQDAIDKAGALYREESRHSAPIEVILQHWGYTSKSSSGLVALAALKKFGLLVDEGTGTGRQARVSEDAFQILVDDRPNSPERLRLIQKAALAPPIHKELWEQYSGKLPSDATLRVQLRNRGFTESAANDFIGELHKTIAFAKLSESGNILGQDSQTPPAEGATPPMQPSTQITHREIPKGKLVLSVSGGDRELQFELPLPMNEAKWTHLKGWIDFIKNEFQETSPKTADA